MTSLRKKIEKVEKGKKNLKKGKQVENKLKKL